MSTSPACGAGDDAGSEDVVSELDMLAGLLCPKRVEGGDESSVDVRACALTLPGESRARQQARDMRPTAVRALLHESL